MANESELLINIVIAEQAKDADRLEPKGMWEELGLNVSLVVDRNLTGEKEEPNPLMLLDETR